MSPINLWEVIGNSFPHPLCHPPFRRCVEFCLKVTKASETRLQPLGDPVIIAAWNMSKRWGFIACWLCATGHCAKCFTLFTHLLLLITLWDRYSNLYSTGEETGSETRNTLLKSHSKSESRPELDPQSLWFQNPSVLWISEGFQATQLPSPGMFVLYRLYQFCCSSVCRANAYIDLLHPRTTLVQVLTSLIHRTLWGTQ